VAEALLSIESNNSLNVLSEKSSHKNIIIAKAKDMDNKNENIVIESKLSMIN
jgi:hypothetical protein